MKSWIKSLNQLKVKRFIQFTALSLGAAAACYLVGRLSAAFGSLAMYGLGALTGGLLLLYFPFIGLLALIVLIPGEELTAFIAGRTFVWVLGVATFGAWLLRVLTSGGKVKLNMTPTALIFLWFLWGLVSTFWAQDQAVALARSIDVAQGAAFIILLQNLVKDNQRLKIVLFAYFGATVFFSFIAIGAGISKELKRIVLTEAQNPNALARALGIGLLLAPYVSSQLRQTRWRVLALIGSLPLMVAIFMTGSRGAWLGLIGAVGLTWLISRGRFIKLRSLIAVTGLLFIVILVLNNYGLISRTVLLRALTLTTSEQTLESSRANIWRVGWEMIKDNPIIGVGLQNFPVRFEDYMLAAGVAGKRGIYPGRDPHSIFVAMQAELGIPGLILILSLFWTILKGLLPYRADKRAICGILLLLFMVLSGAYATILYRKFFWLALGLAMLIPRVIKNGEPPSACPVAHVS